MTVVFHQEPPSSTIMTCFLPFVLWPQGTVIFGVWGFFVYMTVNEMQYSSATLFDTSGSQLQEALVGHALCA